MRLFLMIYLESVRSLYECDSGQEIITDIDLRCDGKIDCTDKSDEAYCLQCSENQFQCLVDQGMGVVACLLVKIRLEFPLLKNFVDPLHQSIQCLHESTRCDGFASCDGEEDELNCSQSCTGPRYYLCPESQCCIDAEDVCIKENYCDCEHGDSDYDYGFYETVSVKKE